MDWSREQKHKEKEKVTKKDKERKKKERKKEKKKERWKPTNDRDWSQKNVCVTKPDQYWHKLDNKFLSPPAISQYSPSKEYCIP